MTTLRKNQGFTLIELMVVISIIGVLSSIVIASLNSARNKAKDSVIKQAVKEFQKLMELEYSDSNSYAKLKDGGGWKNDATECENASFSGSYSNQAKKICTQITVNAPNSLTKFYAYSVGNVARFYSIMVFLNNGNIFCAGSSGKISEYNPGVNPNWGGDGCYDNP